MASPQTYSVVIPAYEALNFIDRAIKSVMAQTVTPNEIIVVDDGSTDGITKHLETRWPQVIQFSQNNQGQGAAMNRGVQLANSPIIGFLDADDEWTPDCARSHLPLLAANDVSVGLVENILQVDGSTRVLSCSRARLFGATFFRREIFDKVGPITEDGHIHEVFEWWTRATEMNISVAENDSLVLRRIIHGANQGLREGASDGRLDLLQRVRNHRIKTK